MNLRPASAQRYLRAARRLTPAPFKRAVRWAVQTSAAGPEPASAVTGNRYADLYENHATAHPPASSIGGGDFEEMGRNELAILVDAGLLPSSSLIDFGCGTGRLAIHAVPYLTSGTYVGTDISPTMLEHAAETISDHLGEMPANVRLATQPDERFPVTAPVDMICAYSVFTHMEHEDTFRYLRSALAVSGRDTRFVASVLELRLPEGRQVFTVSSALGVDQRWAEVRNVVTSRDLFTQVAELAGWTVASWIGADEPAGTLADGSRIGVGQSIVVMRPTLAPADG